MHTKKVPQKCSACPPPTPSLALTRRASGMRRIRCILWSQSPKKKEKRILKSTLAFDAMKIKCVASSADSCRLPLEVGRLAAFSMPCPI